MTSDTIDTFTVNNWTVTIEYDQDCMSPRDCDNLGTMVCWHRCYTLGDPHDFRTPDDFLAWFKAQPGYAGAVILPVYMLEHSGVWLSTGDFRDPWDSGQVGWIYCLPETIRKEYRCQRITKARRDDVRRILTVEVEEYGRYVNGECYGYVIEDANGETLDSCWGFIGYEYVCEAAKEAAAHCTIEEEP